MKKNNYLRTLAIILIIILLSLISFVGIYQKKLNKYENVIPDYETGMEFGKRRSIILKVDDSTQTIYYDKEGNIVEHTHEEGEEHVEGEELEEGHTSEEIPVTSQDVLTEENFNLTKSIILKRLNDLQVPEYEVRKGEDGSFAINLPENLTTDTYVQVISANGIFQLLDSETNEVLLDNNNIKNCEVLYNTTETGTTVYLSIEFKKDARAKLEEISKTVELINKLIIGTPINEVKEKLEFEIKPIINQYVRQHEAIYNAFYDVFNDFAIKNDVSFVGRTKILNQPEFNNVDKIKKIFTKLDDESLLTLVEEDNNDINIYIGNESNVDSDVTVIKTKYKTDSEEGTIAIIGPKRMEYAKVVSLLNYIKENIDKK